MTPRNWMLTDEEYTRLTSDVDLLRQARDEASALRVTDRSHPFWNDTLNRLLDLLSPPVADSGEGMGCG